MRVLVTGSNGLVGSRLGSRLASRGHEVLGVGRGPQRAGHFAYRPAELAAPREVDAAFELRPDVVVHTASMTEVDRCEKAPGDAYRCNVEATANVARASRRVGALLIHVSTDYVFDGEAGPYAEDALPNPRGVYAITKHIAEQAVRVLAGRHAIARTAVVYGWPPAARPNFGSWLVSSLSAGQTVRLFEDQWVSPSLADNVAEMLCELAERRAEGTWNICGAEVVDRVAFGRALCTQFGFDEALIVPSKMREANLPSPRPARSGLLVDKARGELTHKPLGLAESLARFHAAWLSKRQ